MGTVNANRITHIQFHQAVEALKKNRQQFLDARPRLGEATAMLEKLVGFTISSTTMSDIRETSGVVWEARREYKTESAKSNATRTLARAVMVLYKKLGEEPPASLTELIDSLVSPQTNGQPINT